MNNIFRKRFINVIYVNIGIIFYTTKSYFQVLSRNANNYSFFFDLNKECVIGKGTAIFFHCFGKDKCTDGCVAVAEENMVKIMQAVDMGARVIIADFSGRE